MDKGGVELKPNRKKSEETVAGMIVPIKWSEDGKVIGVSIKVLNRDAYLVEHNRTGQELLALVHREIEASGKIRKRLDGKDLISIHTYKLVE